MTAAGGPADPLRELVAVMDRLRSPGGCPWDAQQTHASLVPYLLEEAHELAEAVDEGDRAAIHRLREITGPGGAHSEELDVIRLDRVGARDVEREAAPLGLIARPERRIPATAVYVGSTVVMLGG